MNDNNKTKVRINTSHLKRLALKAPLQSASKIFLRCEANENSLKSLQKFVGWIKLKPAF